MNESKRHSKTLCYTANLQLQIAQKQSNPQFRARQSNSVNSAIKQSDKPWLRRCLLGIAADLTGGAAQVCVCCGTLPALPVASNGFKLLF